MSIPAGERARKIPLKPGYYWAKWRTAADGTVDGDELTPSDNWEIVQVVENDPDWEIHPAEEKALFVFVCGVGEAQWRDGFVWGDFIAPLDNGRGTSPTAQAVDGNAVKALREVRAQFDVEYHADGRVASVGHASDGLRKIVSALDAALSKAKANPGIK
ncbi:hypothetical protein NKH72_21695 [Mesorhizobium sp. M0955]|uniref:hypothetical protein n=1 Tax=Mesorhizobium sp. M0955 TaxID=2957033 RepID=UPI003335DF0C